MTDEQIKEIFFVRSGNLKVVLTKASPQIFFDKATKVYRTTSIGNICIQKEISINGEVNLCAISDVDNCHHNTSNQYSVASEAYLQNLIETARRLAFYIKLGKPKLN